MKALLSSLLLLVATGPAAARSLYWSAIDVSARLDAEGVLHVRERQSMVFDGAWNGGERTFRVAPGQKLRLEGIARIEPGTGRRVELSRGNLERVDEWDWDSQSVLRWRSRLPSDPPFDDQALVYELDYTLGGVLRDDGDGYLLDHDFAFAERAGRIERFSLALELDPVWRAPDLPRALELENLAPGRGVLVTARLDHLRPDPPAAADRSVADHKIYALALAVLSLLGLSAVRLWRAETASGRRERPAVPRPIHREWLAEHVFSLRPEEAGALWDGKIGAPEVAAVIARLVDTGKLASRVTDEGRWWRRPEMELELLVDREELHGYERRLIDKFFFDGRTKTGTKALRKHYSSTGFDPAAIVRPRLQSRLKRLPGGHQTPPAPPWKPTVLLFVLWLAAFALEALTRGPAALGPLVAVNAILVPIPVLWGYLAAAGYRKGVGRPPLAWIGLILPIALLAGGCLYAAWSGAGGREIFTSLRPGIFGALALALLPVWIGVSILNQAQTREARAIVDRRKLLAAARRHLAEQLDGPTPDLEDDWFPYILAFGLSREADEWTKSYGAAARSPAVSTWSASRPGSGAASGGWSGGGGAFGGAGATAAWTAAATGMAAGVSAPSSGGSGGGGGGSSGGGGGGGW